MGLLTTVKKEEIESFLRKRGLGGLDSYIVASRYNGFLKGLAKLLASGLYYAIDCSSICIIAATDDYLLTVNLSWRFSGNLETLPDDRIQKIPWNEIQDFAIKSYWKVSSIISWVYNGKKSSWIVDIADPGIWHFNPEHFEQFKKYTLRK